MFGKRLAEIRNRKGISQYELAEQLNLSRTQLANYEQGIREPDFVTLVTLADYFEVSLDFLLGRTDHEFTVNATEQLFSVVFFEKEPEQLTKDEVEFLRETLHIVRKYKARWMGSEVN